MYISTIEKDNENDSNASLMLSNDDGLNLLNHRNTIAIVQATVPEPWAASVMCLVLFLSP